MDNYSSLSVDEVADLISKAGFEAESQYFRDAEIDGSVLPLITEDHLKEIGVELIGPRLLILRYIKRDIVGQQQGAKYSQPPQQRTTFNDSGSIAATAKPQRQVPQQSSTQKQNSTASRPSTAAPSASTRNNGEVPKWQRDHDKMVESIRAARKYAAYEKAKAEGKAVGPPPEMPAFEEPEGLVQCPTCGRKMSEEAAKHHFEVCARMNFDKSNRMKAGKY